MKFKFRIDVKGFMCNNFWWKIISLIVAVIIWAIVRGDPTQGIRI